MDSLWQEEEEDDDDDDIFNIISVLLGGSIDEPERRTRGTALPGALYVEQLLESDNEIRIHDTIRMNSTTFFGLEAWLMAFTTLSDSRKVKAREKLMMFLSTVTHDCSNRAIQERYSHSGSTVSR
jgi:hypothetical protein